MVDLGGGPDGPIEHGFSNTVFIIPGLIIFGLSGITYDNMFVYIIFSVFYLLYCSIHTIGLVLDKN